MPIGPSHGSRGGGGFSRGSDGGRPRGHSHSHSGGSFLGSVVGHVLGAAILTAGARRRRRRFESRYGYNPSDDDLNSMPTRKAPTFLLVIAIIIAIISAFTMTLRNGTLNQIKTLEETTAIIKTDMTEYRDLITNATPSGNNGFYTTTATFNQIKYSSYSDNPTTPAYYLDFTQNGVQYYFIVYEYEDHLGETYIGTTYTQFSANQIQAMNGEIEIAYCAKANNDHYSINLNYNFENCAEYKYYLSKIDTYKASAKSSLTTFLVELAIASLFVALYIVKLKKYKKLVAQDEELLYKKQQAEVDKAEAEADAAQQVAQRHNRFCQYCGGQLDADSNTCTSCGAKFGQN